MKKVRFVYNPGNTFLAKEETKEYDDYVPDSQIDKDYEEWLLEQAENGGKSYWEEIERTEEPE